MDLSVFTLCNGGLNLAKRGQHEAAMTWAYRLLARC